MTLKSFIKTTLKYWWVILISMVVFAGLAVAYSNHKYKPVYSSTSNFIIQPKKTTLNQVEMNQDMMMTYQDLISTRKVTYGAYKNLKKDKNFTGSDVGLKDNITVEANSNATSTSTLIKMTTDGTSKSLAVKTNNEILRSFKKEMKSVFPSVKVIDVSKASKKSAVSKTTKSTKKYLLVGIMFGVVFGIAAGYLLDMLRQRSVN